eukprot:TRINITY_DN14826_c0_g1_i3.p1 TRINITY_DN14826_c0_g1~~TRINITY_DN14826_c0_g1_i3.p1  ORF type:complete len:112 (-),score=7.31 TRINITY_DN14826_c0_g1_i3:299-634(-)
MLKLTQLGDIVITFIYLTNADMWLGTDIHFHSRFQGCEEDCRKQNQARRNHGCQLDIDMALFSFFIVHIGMFGKANWYPCNHSFTFTLPYNCVTTHPILHLPPPSSATYCE